MLYLRVGPIPWAKSQINKLALILDDHSDMREIELHLMDHEKLIYGHIISSPTRELVQQSFMPGNNAAQFQRSNREHPRIKTFSKGGVLKKKSTCKQKGNTAVTVSQVQRAHCNNHFVLSCFYCYFNFFRVQ